MTEHDGPQVPRGPLPEEPETPTQAGEPVTEEPPVRPPGDRTVVFGAPQLGGSFPTPPPTPPPAHPGPARPARALWAAAVALQPAPGPAGPLRAAPFSAAPLWRATEPLRAAPGP